MLTALVTIEQLEARPAFSARSGVTAASMAYCDQSSIVRRASAALKVFALSIERGREFEISGDFTLLRLQRFVHQHARFLGYRPLRLDATHYIRSYLAQPPSSREDC